MTEEIDGNDFVEPQDDTEEFSLLNTEKCLNYIFHLNTYWIVKLLLIIGYFSIYFFILFIKTYNDWIKKNGNPF